MIQTRSTRTVCCPSILSGVAVGALLATAAAFNAAATFCAQVAWHERITNKNKLHHAVYDPTCSTYGLGAQLACCARDQAAEAVRAARANGHNTCPTFKPDRAIRYDARTYRLMCLDRVRLNTLAGRVVGQLLLGEFQRRYLDDTSWKIGGAERMHCGGRGELPITQPKAAPTPDEPTGFLGVDFGIVNLAADRDGETHA